MAAIAAASYQIFSSSLGLLANGTSPGVFLSPLSIVYALGLALNGAGPQSPTHVELLGVLTTGGHGSGSGGPQALSETDLNSELGRAMMLLNGVDPASGSQVVLANSVWTRNGVSLHTAYVDAVSSLFHATAREATRGAADINEWVSGVTKGMINDLISSDNFDAVLANAIYFKGLWAGAFTPESTQDGDFTTGAGARKTVKMMQKKFEGSDRIPLLQLPGKYDAIALPYKGGAFQAVALLPAEGAKVEDVLRDWSSGQQKLAAASQGVRVVLPRFKVESSMSLTPVLKQLGVQAAFGAGADFSRLSASPLFISDVVHKAVVEVDEEGTVAAAATVVVMLRSRPAPVPELVFNRPFLFIIQHLPTGLPAFTGLINDPSA